MAVYEYHIEVFPRGVWAVGDPITAITLDLNDFTTVNLFTSGTQTSGRAPAGGQIAGSGTAAAESFTFTYDALTKYPKSITVQGNNFDVRFVVTVTRITPYAVLFQGAGAHRLDFWIPSVPLPNAAFGSRIKFNGTLAGSGSIGETSEVAGFLGRNSTAQAGPDVYLAENSLGKKELMLVRDWSRTATIWSDVNPDGRGFEPGVTHTDLTFTRTSLDPTMFEKLTKSRAAPLTVKASRCRAFTTGDVPASPVVLGDPDGLMVPLEPWSSGGDIYTNLYDPKYATAECRMYVNDQLVLLQRVSAPFGALGSATAVDLFRGSVDSNFSFAPGQNGSMEMGCVLLNPPANSSILAVADVTVVSDAPLYSMSAEPLNTGGGPAWFAPNP